jgi:cytochrome P450
MSDQQIRDEMMTLYLAGQENTATTLMWACILLTQYPKAADLLYAEVDQVLGGRTPTADDVPSLVYARAVIDETLRLYPPAWIISRVAAEDDVLDGVSIPAGTLVLASPYTTQRDPRYWPDPDRFIPDRFLSPGDADRPKFAYFPFGGGPRLCIGQHFALIEASLVLAMIAQRYKLDLAPGADLTPQTGLSLRPRGPVLMRLTPRLS